VLSKLRNGHFGDFGGAGAGVYPTDNAAAAFTKIGSYVNGLKVPFMVSDQFLANRGGLIRRRAKVTSDYRFWRRWRR